MSKKSKHKHTHTKIFKGSTRDEANAEANSYFIRRALIGFKVEYTDISVVKTNKNFRLEITYREKPSEKTEENPFEQQHKAK